MRKFNNIDTIIAENVKKANDRLNNEGMTTAHISGLMGVSAQQWCKYLNGINRIPASRLYEFSKLSNRPIATFFL